MPDFQIASGYSDALPQGTRVGTIVLGRPLGQGACGIVYEAEDDVLGRVAVKELYPKSLVSRLSNGAVRISKPDDDWQRAFDKGKEEFKVQAAVLSGNECQHPNVVRCHGLREYNDSCFLIMDYIEGRSLEWKLKERAMTPDEVRRLAGQLMNALEKIHSIGLIHRDISPDNIIVTPGDDWRAILIDFGTPLGFNASGLTRMVGKLGYAPYELFRGIGRELGPATDIYSAAAVLFTAIVGSPPQSQFENRWATHQDFIAVKLLTELKPEGFNSALLSGIDKALSVLPQDRPQNVKEWRTTSGLGTSGPHLLAISQ